MKINIGDTVTFRLDGSRRGTGIVTRLPCSDLPINVERVYDVKLSEPCKEFSVGTTILVDKDEIVDVKPLEYDPVDFME